MGTLKSEETTLTLKHPLYHEINRTSTCYRIRYTSRTSSWAHQPTSSVSGCTCSSSSCICHTWAGRSWCPGRLPAGRRWSPPSSTDLAASSCRRWPFPLPSSRPICWLWSRRFWSWFATWGFSYPLDWRFWIALGSCTACQCFWTLCRWLPPVPLLILQW